jgi:hypothetical protein
MMWDMLFQHHRSGTGYLFPAANTRDKLLMTFGFRFQRFGRRRGQPCFVLARVTDACERVLAIYAFLLLLIGIAWLLAA